MTGHATSPVLSRRLRTASAVSRYVDKQPHVEVMLDVATVTRVRHAASRTHRRFWRRFCNREFAMAHRLVTISSWSLIGPSLPAKCAERSLLTMQCAQ